MLNKAFQSSIRLLKWLESLHISWICSTKTCAAEIEPFKKEIDIKERMITQLLNTVNKISTVNITQNVKPGPIGTCENETNAKNILDMKTNHSERERNIEVIFNDKVVTNSQAPEISLSKQLKSVERQKKEEFYQFKPKQPIDTNIQIDFKLKHQGLCPSWTTVIVGDSTINYVTEVRINKKDRPIKVRNFPEAILADMEYYPIPIIQRNLVTLFYTSGEMMLWVLPLRTVLEKLLKLEALVKDSLPKV